MNENGFVNYHDYIKSEEWRAKAKAAYIRAEYHCCLCGKSDAKINAHHNTYERLGKERPADLAVLCCECHKSVKARITPTPSGGRRPPVDIVGENSNQKPKLPLNQEIMAEVERLGMTAGKIAHAVGVSESYVYDAERYTGDNVEKVRGFADLLVTLKSDFGHLKQPPSETMSVQWMRIYRRYLKLTLQQLADMTDGVCRSKIAKIMREEHVIGEEEAIQAICIGLGEAWKKKRTPKGIDSPAEKVEEPTAPPDRIRPAADTVIDVLELNASPPPIVPLTSADFTAGINRLSKLLVSGFTMLQEQKDRKGWRRKRGDSQ